MKLTMKSVRDRQEQKMKLITKGIDQILKNKRHGRGKKGRLICDYLKDQKVSEPIIQATMKNLSRSEEIFLMSSVCKDVWGFTSRKYLERMDLI